MRRIIKIMLLSCLMALSGSGLTVSAQTPLPNEPFPHVVSSEIVDFGGNPSSLRISNGAKYFINAPDLWQRGTPQQTHIPIAGRDPATIPGWSVDSRYAAIANDAGICTDYPELQSTLYVTDVTTNQITRLCLPLKRNHYSLHWTPFGDTDLLLNTFFGEEFLLLNWTSHQLKQIRPLQSMGAITAMMSKPYIGLGQYLWSLDTQTLIGQVLYTFQPDTARLSLCPPTSYGEPNNAPCKILADLSHYNITGTGAIYGPPKISTAGNFVLWGGLEANPISVATAVATSTVAAATAANTPTPLPRMKRDTVLYLTNLNSGETKEIFRLSSLKQADLSTEQGFDWSPDGKTIAMTLLKFKNADGTSSESAGTLLITLDWPPPSK